MNEVCYSGHDLDLVNEFNLLEDKSSVSWGDDKFKHLRKTIKDHYLKEQDSTCYFCRQKIVVRSNRAWDAEHIISKLTYPEFTFEPRNICICCPDCNNAKRNRGVLVREKCKRFPFRSKAYKIVHPHFDVYDEHVHVLVPGRMYQWKTPKGQFTIEIYGLNRFAEYSGRDKDAGRDHKIQSLMESAQVHRAGTPEYKQAETEMVVAILLGRASVLGHEETLNMIAKLSD